MVTQNTSATGGYLTPAAPPVEGNALEDFLHDVIVGITGLDADEVRPRWQPEPPNLPDESKFWCAFGVMSQDPDFNSFLRHVPGGQGLDQMERHEDLDVLLSFYSASTGAQVYAEYWRDGLMIPQNQEQMQIAKWGLIESGGIRPVPTLVKQRWLYRSDITTRFRRLITNTYPVLNLLSASVILHTADPLITQTLLITNPPTP